MSTRGFYVFFDGERGRFKLGDLNVYRHCDNYPSGAAEALNAAMAKAWELPRFEADEFAAAFIAANKDVAGGLRCFPSGPWQDVAPGDVEYIYFVTARSGKIHVTCAEPGKHLFEGTLDQFSEWAEKREADNA